MKKDYQFDNEELEILNAIEKHQIVESKNQEKEIASLVRTAKNTLKRRPITLRIPEVELINIREKAAEEGIPYQTLILSVIHKYNSGKLVER